MLLLFSMKVAEWPLVCESLRAAYSVFCANLS